MNAKTITTCGQLYLEGLAEHGFGKSGSRAFAIGFMSGQAEKVYLGVCPAAMFHPSPERFDWMFVAAEQVARQYGLIVISDPIDREIWIYRHFASAMAWSDYEKNSPSWHSLRAKACGMPESEIDLEFHNRSGGVD